MKKWLKRIGIVVAILVALVIGVLVYYSAIYPPTYPETPKPEITASQDPEVIARGEYLFKAVAHCNICHTPREEYWNKPDVSDVVPSGNHVWEMGPIGTIRSANITPDDATGIGTRTDAELARAIRYGIKANDEIGVIMLAIGPMSDEDLTAIISYVRSIPPVQNEVPPIELTAVGKAMVQIAMAGYLKPKPELYATPQVPFVREGEISVERGRYLAMGPAYCFACHSEGKVAPDLVIEEPYFAGSITPMPDPKNSDMEMAAPNLTPHPEYGRIASLTEEQFIERMRGGRTVQESPMPWESYRLMTDEDLASIYRFLMSLDPVDRNPGPSYREAGWEP